MKIKGVSPDGKKSVEIESELIDDSFIRNMTSFESTEEEIRKRIERLDVSADVKSLLMSLTCASFSVGRQIIRVGRKIVDFVVSLIKQFPKLTFFAVLGAVAGFLVASIPLLGFLLGPIVTPIAIAVGAAFGLLEDLRDQALKRKIVEFHAQFSPLGASQ